MNLELSIIIPTLNRKVELEQLIKSIIVLPVLENKIEIIVIDQNDPSFLNDLRIKYNYINWQSVCFRGLSKAKNYGFTLCKGKWVLFPDDDSMFLDNTLSTFLKMKDSEYDIICGKCIDENGCDSVAKFSKNSFSLSKNKFSGGFIEATTFIKREVLEKFKFDENLGVGNFHGAEEGFDWIFSILKENKFHAYFETNLKFYHPSVKTKMDKKLLLHRVFSYRAGFSYVCLKHKLYFKLFKRIFLVSLAVIYYRVTNPYKFRYYFAEILGILSGIILPPK